MNIDFAETWLKSYESCSYLTDATVTKLDNDTYLIWMWYPIGNQCLVIWNTGEIIMEWRKWFSNPHPWASIHLSGKTSYHQILWSLKAARLDIIIISLWNLTNILAEVLSRSMPNLRAIGKVLTRIWRLQGFTRSYGKTSVRLVNRGSGLVTGGYDEVAILNPHWLMNLTSD